MAGLLDWLFGEPEPREIQHARRCRKAPCKDITCRAYWAGYADGNQTGSAAGEARGLQQGRAEGRAAARHSGQTARG